MLKPKVQNFVPNEKYKKLRNASFNENSTITNGPVSKKGRSKTNQKATKSIKRPHSSKELYKLLPNQAAKGSRTTLKARSTRSGHDALLSNQSKNISADQTKAARGSLQNKVINLQKSIDSQETTLQELQTKLRTERSEISFISEQLSGQKTLHKNLNRNHIGAEENPQYLKSLYPERHSVRTKKEEQVPAIRFRKDSADVEADLPETKTLLKNERIRQAELGSYETPADASESQYKQKCFELQTQLKVSEQSNQQKCWQYTRQIEQLLEENYRLRIKHGNGSEKEEYTQRLDQIYRERALSVKDEYERKQQEYKQYEQLFKHELDEAHNCIIKLRKELTESKDLQDQVNDLKHRLLLSNNEINMIKQYYQDKLKNKSSDLEKQKAESSQVHKHLLSEIRALQAKIDHLYFENKKLELNSSHLNSDHSRKK